MKKIVRLTEADLARIVKRVIKENEDEELFATHDYQAGKYYDTMDRRVDSDIEFSEKREFGPEDYDSFMEYINNCDTRWCITTKRMYDAYTSKGNITVGKGKRKVTEGDDEDYDMLPPLPTENYEEFIDQVINNVVKLFNMDLEDGHIRRTYDIDGFVKKMERDLDELFMNFMEEEDLSDETLRELNEYANYKVEKTVDHFYDTVEGMDFPEQFED
jgi:predicted transcriptional regulator